MKISLLPNFLVNLCRPRKKYFNLLLEAGTLIERLESEQHVNVYSNCHAIFKENQWPVDYLTTLTAALINQGASPDQLQTCLDSIAYNLKNQVKGGDKFPGAFSKLIQWNVSPAEWGIYKDLIAYHKKIGYYLDNLTSSFIKLVQAKPSSEAWEVYKDLVKLYKAKNKEVQRLTFCFAELDQRKTSKEQLEVYKDAIVYYLEKDLDLFKLTNGFAHIIKAQPSHEHWQVFKDALDKHKKENLGLDALTLGCAYLLQAKLSPDQLQLYCDSALNYINSGWDVDKLAISFSDLIKADFTPEQWQIFKDIFDHYGSNKWFVTTLISNFTALVQAFPSKEQWQAYKDACAYYKRNNWHVDNLTSGFTKLVQENASPLLLEVYKNANPYDNENNFLRQCCVNLAQENPPQAMLRNFNLALLGGHLKTIDDIHKLLGEITVHAAICNLLRPTSDEIKNNSKNIIAHTATSDPLPYPLNDKENANRVFDQTLQVYRRGFNFYHGYSSLTVDTKTLPNGEPPLFGRFGKAVGGAVERVYAKDANLFPGRGFLIKGLIPSKIFLQDKTASQSGEDPYHMYTEAWPWIKRVFHQLPKTDFLFTRGMTVVTCNDKDYELEDVNGKKIHFSYVIFNDHHHNYGCDAMFLVPTEIIQKRIAGTTISYEDYPAVPKGIKDINEAKLFPKDLIKAAREIPANILNIGWGSNISGGLCNAYPPDSSPFHEWEIQRRADEQKDLYGHVHKSHALGGYYDAISHMPLLEDILIPLRKADKQAFDITNRYQNLFDLFRLSLARYHKGETLGEELEPWEITDDYLFEKCENKTFQVNDAEEIIEGDLNKNPRALRMLVESYKWHKSLKEDGVTDKNRFWVLAVAHALVPSFSSYSM